MKKPIIAFGVVAVILVAAFAVSKGGPKEVMVQEASIPIVSVENPTTENIELFRSVVGTVAPSDVVYLYPTMSGEVTEVFVKSGDFVEEGQSLCTIDTSQIESARLALESAEISRNDANTTLARQQVLYSAGDIAQATYEAAQVQARTAQIQYETAKLNYDNQVEYSNITANISGTIESFDVQVYDNVTAQTLLAVIAGEGSKTITFSVPEKIVTHLNVGDGIQVERSGVDYEGTITEVSNMVNSTTGLFQIKAVVEDAQDLSTGVSVNLVVTSDKAENTMALPVSALYYASGDAYVHIYQDGVVRIASVEVGIYDEDYAQIISGITFEDLVITTWSSELFEGSTVQLANETVVE